MVPKFITCKDIMSKGKRSVVLVSIMYKVLQELEFGKYSCQTWPSITLMFGIITTLSILEDAVYHSH